MQIYERRQDIDCNFSGTILSAALLLRAALDFEVDGKLREAVSVEGLPCAVSFTLFLYGADAPDGFPD